MEQVSAFALFWAVENMPCKVRVEWLECGPSWEIAYWKVIDDNWWWLSCLLELQTSKKDST